jgi:Mn-dependent DtxR family transcriptional regulator
MSIVDDRVLEYIRETGSGSPKQMKEEAKIRYTPEYVAQRCRILAERGILRHLGNGVYVITEKGEQYLDGELDTAELEETDNERESSA